MLVFMLPIYIYMYIYTYIFAGMLPKVSCGFRKEKKYACMLFFRKILFLKKKYAIYAFFFNFFNFFFWLPQCHNGSRISGYSVISPQVQISSFQSLSVRLSTTYALYAVFFKKKNALVGIPVLPPITGSIMLFFLQKKENMTFFMTSHI